MSKKGRYRKFSPDYEPEPWYTDDDVPHDQINITVNEGGGTPLLNDPGNEDMLEPEGDEPMFDSDDPEAPGNEDMLEQYHDEPEDGEPMFDSDVHTDDDDLEEHTGDEHGKIIKYCFEK